MMRRQHRWTDPAKRLPISLCCDTPVTLALTPGLYKRHGLGTSRSCICCACVPLYADVNRATQPHRATCHCSKTTWRHAVLHGKGVCTDHETWDERLVAYKRTRACITSYMTRACCQSPALARIATSAWNAVMSGATPGAACISLHSQQVLPQQAFHDCMPCNICDLLVAAWEPGSVTKLAAERCVPENGQSRRRQPAVGAARRCCCHCA